MSFEALIISCNCDIDGPPLEPSWFGPPIVPDGSGSPTTPLAVDPLVADPGETKNWLIAHFDPGGEIPDPIPFDAPVTLIGQFGHPAAGTCRWDSREAAGQTSPVNLCRTTFAITSLRPSD